MSMIKLHIKYNILQVMAIKKIIPSISVRSCFILFVHEGIIHPVVGHRDRMVIGFITTHVISDYRH